MTVVQRWSGQEASALRRALRLSVRAFAEHLGVATRTVTKWEALGASTAPRPDSQAVLDTALSRAAPDVRLRFELLLGEDHAPLFGERRRASREWDYETWTDDLGRASACLARQDFAHGMSMVDRWLHRYRPHDLDSDGRYLHGRSLVLMADLRRDQGSAAETRSARRLYGAAHRLFRELAIPRRMAQVELSLAVVDEMDGLLSQAAGRYELLADDARLSPRDRARARLWVGTALSKSGQNESAIRIMGEAVRHFEAIEEPEDWSVAQQKLALAHRAVGSLGGAHRHLDMALSRPLAGSPMQRVRLTTAHAHILLSDRGSANCGLRLLDQAMRMARAHGMLHQARSIDTIRRGFERAEGTAGRRAHSVGGVKRVTDEQWADAEIVWDYHRMGHALSRCDAAIGLGSHDLGVATLSAELYRAELFPVVVFSGGNSATTADRFPRGEAVHYREHVLSLGVPDDAILVESTARNTGQNITLSRAVLADHGHRPRSLLLISKPYMERRAYATCRQVWPEVEVTCVSEPLTLTEYVKSIGDERLVVDMLVGDLQRIIEYPRLGFAVEQPVPGDVVAAYRRLVDGGFVGRLLG